VTTDTGNTADSWGAPGNGESHVPVAVPASLSGRLLRLLALVVSAALVTALVAITAGPASADTLDPPSLNLPADLATVNTNPTFTWDSVPLATKYRIQVSTSPIFSGTPAYAADVVGTSATPIAELPLGSLYWHVASLDSTSTLGLYSATRSFTRNQPLAPTLTNPANLHAFVYPTEAPVLRWNAVPGMVTYKVQIDDAADFVGATTYTTESTSFSLPAALPSDSLRYWRVQGVSTTAAVTTAWSSDTDLRSFSVTWPQLARPTLLSPANDLSTAVDDVTFSWSPVPGAASYELETATDSGFTANAVTHSTSATQYRALDTLPADQYWWHVRAVDPSGNHTDWSDASAFNRVWLDQLGREARPTVNLTDADGGTAGVQLEQDKLAISWTPIPRATSYELDVSTDPTFLATSSSTSMVRRTCTTPHTTWTPYLVGDYTETTGFANCAWAGTPTSVATTRFITIAGGPYYVRVRAVEKTPSGDTVTSSWSNAATADRPVPAATVFSVVASTTPTTASNQPAELLASPDAADNPELTWKPVSGAVAYLVWVARDSSFTNPVVSSTGGSYVVTTQTQLVLADVMLDNTVGQPYYWFVLPCSSWTSDAVKTCGVGPEQAINVDGYNASFNKRGSAVSGLTVGSTQTDTVALSWADQLATSPGGGGFRWYEVQVLNSSNTVIDDQSTDATGYTPIGQAYTDGPYTFRVRAIDAAGQALAWSTAPAFTKSSSAPANPTTSASTLRLPILSWDATAFAKNYQVEIYRGVDPTYPGGSQEGPTLTTTYPAATPSDALPAGTYSWRVRQVDADGNTGPWTPGTPNFTVGATAPSLITPGDGASIPTTSLVFGWSSVPDAVRYKVQSSTTSGFGTLFDDVTTVGNAYAPVKAYVGGTTYFWRVVVLNSDGDTVATSPTSSFIAQTTPAAPGASMSVSGTTVTISYTPNATGGSALTGYSVRYRVFGTTTWTYLDRAADTASVALSGMATSTKYEAQVAAVNGVGTSAWSSLVNATTATVPAAPTNLRAVAGAGQLTVSWTAPANGGSAITGYILRWTPSGGSTSQIAVTGTTKALTGLTAGVAYSVDVAAQNLVGTGPFATSVAGTPLATTTPTPTPTPTAGAKATALTIAGGKTVVYGAGGAALTGTLKTTTGTAVGSQAVTVQSRAAGSTTSWSAAGSATTSSTGAWSLTVQPTTNREFRAVHNATSVYGASTSGTATVLVSPKITRKLADSTVKLHARAIFTGKVSPVHKSKTVYLQRLQAGTWVTKKSTTTSSTSTYRLVWNTDSRKDFRWRVYLPKHADHAAGYSKKILLTVK
jgi:hypothetical protein